MEIAGLAYSVISATDLDAWVRFGEDFAWSVIDLPLTPIEDKVSEQAPRGQKTATLEQFSEELATAGLVTKSAVPTVSLRMKSGKAGKQ